MKKIVLILILITCKSYSQSKEYNLVLTYKVTFQLDSVDSKKTYSEDMDLLLSRTESLFVSSVKILVDSVRNSTREKGGSPMEVIDFKNKLPKNRLLYSIRKDFKKQELTFTNKVITKHLEYKEKLYPFKWKLLNKTKTIFGYLCKKAELSYKGRDYIAWFSADIPIQDGPWKFGGLPGAILEINDVRNHYRFKLKGIQKKKGSFPVVAPKYKIIKIKKADYYKTARGIVSNFTNKFLGNSKRQMKELYKNVGKKGKNPIEFEN